MKGMKQGHKHSTDGVPWINPIGGLGDVLMLSGVLKQVTERHPDRRFRLIRRPGYMCILEGHPALIGVGFPPEDAVIYQTDYWSDPAYATRAERPMQILSRMFGLDGEVKERFFVADDDVPDPIVDTIPWDSVNVIIAPGSSSPRKSWRHEKWEALVKRLRHKGCFVLQLGYSHERHVRGAYSIAGLTTPKQVFPILRRADLIVTIDSFLMHAAHHVQIPAVVLWGPTEPQTYGYSKQTHLHPRNACPELDDCITPRKAEDYTKPCPFEDHHCMDQITVDNIMESKVVQKIVSKK
jgi:ADP-heptose:LPS heptosyltransferase